MVHRAGGSAWAHAASGIPARRAAQYAGAASGKRCRGQADPNLGRVGVHLAVSAAGLQGNVASVALGCGGRPNGGVLPAPAKPPDSPLAGVRSPPVGRDECDIPVVSDEKPQTCDDLLCDGEHQASVQAQASAPSGRLCERGWFADKVACDWSCGKSTCAKGCPDRPGALHGLLAHTRTGRDDASHRDFNHAPATMQVRRRTSSRRELEDIYAVDLVDEGPAPGPIPLGARKGRRTARGRWVQSSATR